MPNFTNSEAIAFREDHDRYMAKEVAADKRAEWVEQRVKDLMADGEEYSPFKPENVLEAISEMCFADRSMLAAYIKMCSDNPINFSNHTHLADFVVDRVEDYWHQCAVKH